MRQQSTTKRPNHTLLALIPVLVVLLFAHSKPTHKNLIGTTLFLPVQAMSMTAALTDKTYDVIVIGGGSAGLTAAKLIGPTLQKTCCIIEQNKMGGDCTWTGCIPSKSFIASSKLYYEKHRQSIEEDLQHKTEKDSHPISRKGSYIPPLADLSSVRAEIQGKIQQIYDADDSPEALKKLGNIDVIYGQATIESSKLVLVATTKSTTNSQGIDSVPQRALRAKEGIIVCTGAEPKLPNMIPGLDHYYTYETIWDQLLTIPKQLIVIGGGPIGCEIAQAMARFGSNVTIITTSAMILPQEDPDVSTLMSNLFTTKYNIHIVHGSVTKVDQVSPTAVASTNATTHVAHVSLLTPTSSGQSSTTVSGDAILVAIGRQPRFIAGYENVGIELNERRNAIKVNAQLQTSIPNIYAAGDCTGDRQLYVH
jgi:pyruvate/2-oxoglutarate dehydrogenase complex dihydrolipoamide dehydrogenase (E3) component